MALLRIALMTLVTLEVLFLIVNHHVAVKMVLHGEFLVALLTLKLLF